MKNKQRKGYERGQSIPTVNIDVSNFGPILDGSVDLRPLTIFVGPSNAGKTYFATLVYSLHRVLSGFRRPLGNEWIPPYHSLALSFEQVPSESDTDQLLTLFEVLADQDQDVKWSHLPNFVSQIFTDELTANGLGLGRELLRCFDLTDLTQLICSSSKQCEAKISVDIRTQDHSQWAIDFKISADNGLSTSVKIDDLILIPKGESTYHKSIWHLPGMRDYVDHLLRDQRRLDLIMGELALAMSIGRRRIRDRSIHYLPAARSGIMQGYRIIASSLVSRSTGSGVKGPKEIPTLAGPLADFMEQLLLFNHGRKGQKRLEKIADLLEQKTLGGRIIGRSTVSQAQQEFVYQSSHTQSDIRLSRSSSMVSELAPIVLFLRGVLGLDSTVIIEEPEAHLHPAAQTQLAVILARMVRAGLRLIVTTHSDWLLKSISNLVREGLLHKCDRNSHDQRNSKTFLWKDEVGVWLFRNSDAGSSIEEIPFDTSEGLEPIEYEEVEDALYNQAANLQNRIAERHTR